MSGQKLQISSWQKMCQRFHLIRQPIFLHVFFFYVGKFFRRNKVGTKLALVDTPLRLGDRLVDIAFGSVSTSLYRTYTVRVTAMMGDMEDFFTYRGVIGLSILNIIKWQRIEFIKIRFE